MPDNGIESVALPPPTPASTPSGSQEFAKPLSSKVEFNSHPVSRWGVNGESTQTPSGNPMSVVETVVDDVVSPNVNPGLAAQDGPGAGLESVAWDKKPV